MKSQAEDGVRRLVQDRLENFFSAWDGGKLGQEDIHQLRVLTKRLRAYLAVYPPRCEDDVTRLTAVLKELASCYSGQRDADVLIKTIRNLIRPLDADQRARFEQLLTGLGSRQDETTISPEETRILLLQCFRQWPSCSLCPAQVMEGVGDIYRRARKKGRKAFRQDEEKSYHRWRKRTKELLYALELTEADYKSTLYWKTLKEFAELLGEYHDLNVLAAALATDPAFTQSADLAEQLLALVDERASAYKRKFPEYFNLLFLNSKIPFSPDIALLASE